MNMKYYSDDELIEISSIAYTIEEEQQAKAELKRRNYE